MKKLYPVTILKINPKLQKRLLDNNIITLNDFISNEKIKSRLRKREYTSILNQVKTLLT
jgi:hypothetical protein